MRNSKQSSRFTLIELLSVILIIMLLAGVGVGLTGYAGRKRAEAKSKANLETIASKLEAFYYEHKYYPTTGVDTIESVADAYSELSIGSDLYRDGFSNPFYYKCPGNMNPQKYDLWSAGGDSDYGCSSDSGDEYDCSCGCSTSYPITSPLRSLSSCHAKNSDDISNFSSY